MKRFALIGHNISYSLSPLIHNVVYRELGEQCVYELLSFTQEELSGKIEYLRSLDGFNITKPHKQAILPYLSKNAGGFDAVNTVVCAGGEMTGYNTDIYGFSRDISCAFGDIAGLRALVLGAGGVADPVVYALSAAGAKVTVANRTHQKAELLAKKYGADACGVAALGGIKPQLIVNCTSAGLGGEQAMPLQTDLSKLRYAYDTIYSPPQTEFLRLCEQRGAVTANGLGMLIYQAIQANRHFLDRVISDSDEQLLYRKIYEEIKKQ